MDVDFREVDRGFSAMERRAHALGPAFRQLKPELRADQRDHAARRAGPFAAWAARAPATLAKAKRGKSGRIRRSRPLGKLLTAIDYSATATQVMARSLVDWANVHQEGGRVGRGAVIPARPFLWISDAMMARASEIILRHIVMAFGSR